MKRIMVFVFFILLMFTPICFAANDSIFIGNATIYLGEDKQIVAEKLLPLYELKPLTGNSYMVITKNGPPFEVLGSVDFLNNKVIGITRDWGNFYDVGQAETLIGLIDSVIKDNNNQPIITVSRDYSPKVSWTTLTFWYNSKTVTLSIMRSSEYGNVVDIYEKIQGKQ